MFMFGISSTGGRWLQMFRYLLCTIDKLRVVSDLGVNGLILLRNAATVLLDWSQFQVINYGKRRRKFKRHTTRLKCYLRTSLAWM